MTFTQISSFKSWGVAAAVVLACAAAHAQSTGTITLTGPSANKYSNIYLNDFNNGTTTPNLSQAGAAQISDGSSTFWAYCIDPRTGTAFGLANTYAAASLSNFLNTPLNNTNPASTAYQQQMAGAGYKNLAYSIQDTTLVETSLVSLFSHAYADSLLSATKSAAFGYAVWEIMGQATYGRVTGALRSGGSDTNTSNGDALEVQIDAYLTALNSGTWTSVNGANLTAVTNYIYTVYYDPATHTAQNFIKVTGSVPEPATLALVGAALFGASTLRRRTVAPA